MKTLEQNITGQKFFESLHSVWNVLLHDYENGGNISRLIELQVSFFKICSISISKHSEQTHLKKYFTFQAMKNIDNIFKTSFNFNEKLLVQDLSIAKLYNDINVPKLVEDLEVVSSMQIYRKHFEDLFNATVRARDLLNRK